MQSYKSSVTTATVSACKDMHDARDLAIISVSESCHASYAEAADIHSVQIEVTIRIEP